ncbi:periplasmic heavy metal sensor [Pseudomonas aeruginosa]|uniref:periplasmic heavy metal sensor n=1 Tax=Pseudomonas aeruginosa TaxID=287 RepID=UPI003D18CDB1
MTKRYEYNALLAANPPDSSKINAVAKEMENLRQSLDELRVKRDIAMAEAGIPRHFECRNSVPSPAFPALWIQRIGYRLG